MTPREEKIHARLTLLMGLIAVSALAGAFWSLVPVANSCPIEVRND